MWDGLQSCAAAGASRSGLRGFAPDSSGGGTAGNLLLDHSLLGSRSVPIASQPAHSCPGSVTVTLPGGLAAPGAGAGSMIAR